MDEDEEEVGYVRGVGRKERKGKEQRKGRGKRRKRKGNVVEERGNNNHSTITEDTYNYLLFPSTESHINLSQKSSSSSPSLNTPPSNAHSTITHSFFKSISRDQRASIQDPKFLKETPKIGLYNPKFSLTRPKIRNIFMPLTGKLKEERKEKKEERVEKEVKVKDFKESKGFNEDLTLFSQSPP